MNFLHLGHRLGAVSSPILQRAYHEQHLYGLQHDEQTTFSFARLAGDVPASANVAHPNGVNCLALRNDKLLTGGADACIRLWDLSTPNTNNSSATYHPLATLTRSPTAHTNALTSISIYPFDPEPNTVISTSYDTNLLLTSITPTSLQPAHTFPLQHPIYTHAISPIPTHSPLIAAGTASPSIRLLDLRSGLATHALPGHNGAIYSLAWSPKTAHILASGAADGRVLFFDIRRANAAFASLDLEDPIGVSLAYGSRLGGGGGGSGSSSSGRLLNFNAQAHTGPVTSVQWTPGQDRIVTVGHDQRIRVWDAATGRNELVHFGPRIRNARKGQFGPLLLPGSGYVRKGTQEVLLWANDDGKGEVGVYGMREGDERGRMLVGGTVKGRIGKEKLSEGEGLRARGRINGMVWRDGWEGGVGGLAGLELVTAHGDGSVGLWRVPGDGDEGEEPAGERNGGQGGGDTRSGGRGLGGNGSGSSGSAAGKKRKRQDFSALVEGLSKIRRPEK